MTQDERNALGRTIATMAMYYNRPNLTPETLTMYIDDLASYDYRVVSDAISKYRRDPRNRMMFLPAQIIGIIDPSADSRSVAIEAASRVIGAVGKFGWCNPLEAKLHIGDLGWRAVERLGGWEYLCENLGNEMSLTTVQAQIRDLCESTAILTAAGHDGPPGLPSGPNHKALGRQDGLVKIGEIIKGIVKKD